MEKRYLSFIGILFIMFVACKKNKQDTPAAPVPTVTAVTPSSGQTGDTIIITGTNFSTVTKENEVAINGIPAQVTVSTGNQIKAIIPPFCQTGELMITVSNISVKGPALTVIPSPEVKMIFPGYGFAGDTLTITGKHFSSNLNENHIELNGQAVPVESQQGDTLLTIVVPEGDASGVLNYSTFTGRKKEYPQRFLFRKPYTGTIMQAIRQDPGFSYTNAIMERMKEVYPDFYVKIEAVWNSSIMHTVFLRDDITLKKHNQHFTSLEYVRNNVDPQSFYYFFLMTTTGGSIAEADFSNREYPSMLSEEEAWGGPGSGGRPDYFIPFVMIHSASETFISLSDNPSKVIRTDLRATNGMIHQIE